MPLLKRKTLEKVRVDEFLRDDEEVFHCPMTNEIFRDYDEFAERTILCNSMVWTCSMTGKSNLTYEEALQSEQNAERSLQEFPVELRIPVLFVANLTKKTYFTDLAEEVFAYIKDHYFIGENISACVGNNKWKDFHVVQVIPPTTAEIEEYKKVHSGNGEASLHSLYKYELEQSDNQTKLVTDFLKVRRQKSYFSKEKCKLFLKQHVEQMSGGVVGIKKATLEKFGINNMKFDQIFAGPLPIFAEKKSLKTTAVNGKKVRQETLAKFLSKNNIIIPKTDAEKAAEETKRKEKELQIEREKEKRQQEREARKQRNIEIGIKLRDWSRPTEDLLLEDQKVIPNPTPIKSRIPDKYLGDALCVMEFTNTFANILETRNYFFQGISLAVMERILLDTKAGSPMTDLIQMLLRANFKLLHNEKQNYGGKQFTKSLATEDTIKSDRCHLWCRKTYGTRLYELALSTLTVSEVLRLHLLGSGENVSDNGVKWRAQFRGGYGSEEDPAIQLRLHNPHILKSLTLHHVCQLPMTDKLKVLNCLVSQLLTFKEVRDSIEEHQEETRTVKGKIKAIHLLDRKQLSEIEAKIEKIKNGSVATSMEASAKQLNELRASMEKIKNENESVVNDLNKVYQRVNYLGRDRAYRVYYKLNSLPALVINQDDSNLGPCLPELVQHVPELINANRDQIMKHLNKIADEMNSSDKENEPKENGVESKLATTAATINELLMCSTDPTTCVVHSASQHVPKWSVVFDCDKLLDALNARGVRETDLKRAMERDMANITKLVSRTPSYVSDCFSYVQARANLRSKEENLGYPDTINTDEALRSVVVESIMELEMKLFTGYLGGISRERDEFRKLVEDNNYERIEDLIRPRRHIVSDEEGEAAVVRPIDSEDPGAYLEAYRADIDSEDSDVESDEMLLMQTLKDKLSIKFLAQALTEIAFSVKPHFLLRPLGAVVNPKQRKLNTRNTLSFWEQSLINSTSYSQLLLHYTVLESSIMWSKSTNLVKCKTCNKGRDDENILLCDYCNDGYHLYCLKPKLTTVPKGEWYCVNCVGIMEKKAKEEESEDDELFEDEDTSMEVETKPDECAVCGYPENEDSLQCVICSLVYHIECTDLKRSMRGAWTCTQCKNSESQTNGNDSAHGRRSGRNHEHNEELPLNNAALQELLRDVMKHEDGWPFVRPVPKHEVPDYYDIITKPMDFGTIKYKLNMGDYRYDDEVIADCQLIFENCHTYNSSQDEVYQCGSRLATYFVKKCKDLKLELNGSFSMEMNGGSAEEKDYEPARKSRRTK